MSSGPTAATSGAALPALTPSQLSSMPDVPESTAAPLPRHVLEQLGEQSDLLATWWPAVLLGLLALALVVVAVLRHRRRPRRRAWPVGALAAVAAVLAAAAGVNAHLAYFSSLAAVQTWVTGHVDGSDGRVTTVSVPLRAGSGLGPSDTWVYTPPGYDASSPTRYPVVYLLHGEPGSSADWFSAGDVAHTADVLIRDHLIPPVVLVAPDLTAPSTDDTECLDSTRAGGPQVETHVDDVVSWVDAHYATQADAAHRVVAGMSMGGYCALDQGLRHQDLYGAIIGLEPFGDPGDGGRAALSTQAEYDAVSPSWYAATIPLRGGQPVFLDTAEDGDPAAAADVDRISDVLAARGVDVTLRQEEGYSHSWAMASLGIAPGLVWTFQQLGLSPAS